jgi:hypothetical protein
VPIPSPAALDTDTVRLAQLTTLHFAGFAREPGALAGVLEHARALRALTLDVHLDCALSPVFRKASALGAHALPRLERFAFSVAAVSSAAVAADPALFPAVSDFLRNRGGLRALTLRAPGSQSWQKKLGYDAAAWGVLPSLPGLRALAITLPESVAPQLATWLIPRGLVALSLYGFPAADAVGFVRQLRGGVPPTLRFVELDAAPAGELARIVEDGFPMVAVLGANGAFWTVKRRPQPAGWASPRTDGEEGGAKEGSPVGLERWPERRVQCYAREWLEWFGCEDARPPGFEDFGET